jgi:hypothetical protein
MLLPRFLDARIDHSVVMGITMCPSRRLLTPRNVLATLGFLVCLLPAGVARGDFLGTLYYTTFAGAQNVNRIDYDYNPGVSFTLSNNKNIASVPGADGVVFTSDGYLAVGGQSPSVYKVNPTTGAFTSVSTGNPNITAYEMMADPTGKVYSSGSEGGTPTPVSYNSTLTVNGTPHPVTGNDTGVTHIAWTDATHAFYTNASGGNGFGNFGTIDPTTFVTTRVFTSLPAAHGLTYDPYTGDLILFGDSHVTQIDPNTLAVVSDLALGLGSNFDQGSVDGLGHIFIANNGGNMAFIDIANSKKVGAADFMATPFVAGALDDIAPLVGPGSTSLTPEPASMALVTAGGLALLGYHWRRRQKRQTC